MAASLQPSKLHFSDLLRTATIGIRTRKRRSALSALGIMIGIAAMVAVMGLSQSSKSELLAQLERLGTNLLTGGTQMQGLGHGIGHPAGHGHRHDRPHRPDRVHQHAQRRPGPRLPERSDAHGQNRRHLDPGRRPGPARRAGRVAGRRGVACDDAARPPIPTSCWARSPPSVSGCIRSTARSRSGWPTAGSP